MNQRDSRLEESLRAVPRDVVEGLVAHIRGGGVVLVDFGWRTDAPDGGGNPVGLALSEVSFRRILEGQADGETGWDAGAALELALGAFPKWAAQYVESAMEPLPKEARSHLLGIAEYVLSE